MRNALLALACCAALSSAFALADPPQVWWRLLLNLVLPIIFVVISIWQLFAMRKRQY